MKKSVLALLSLILLLCAAAAPVSASLPPIFLRVEGITGNLCNKSGTWSNDTDTAAKALAYFETLPGAPAFTGLADGYITAVNGEAAGAFGGWDGWSFLVNGEMPMTGIADTSIAP
ncbi:MAG: DUF4430 domain-containing protein, partial [Oscillospiraceae bacterium]|nr:DUF4430 domain-containing protein [Oscillospiraceae bacterium]